MECRVVSRFRPGRSKCITWSRWPSRWRPWPTGPTTKRRGSAWRWGAVRCRTMRLVLIRKRKKLEKNTVSSMQTEQRLFLMNNLHFRYYLYIFEYIFVNYSDSCWFTCEGSYSLKLRPSCGCMNFVSPLLSLSPVSLAALLAEVVVSWFLAIFIFHLGFPFFIIASLSGW